MDYAMFYPYTYLVLGIYVLKLSLKTGRWLPLGICFRLGFSEISILLRVRESFTRGEVVISEVLSHGVRQEYSIFPLLIIIPLELSPINNNHLLPHHNPTITPPHPPIYFIREGNNNI